MSRSAFGTKRGRTNIAAIVGWYGTTAPPRPTTRRDYRKLLDLEILPTFAATPLARIDALAVREWLATLAAGPLRWPAG